MSNVIKMPNLQEGKMRETMNNLAESAIDLAMYCSYVFNRGNSGISVDGMKAMNFAGSHDQIDLMERHYQAELRSKS